MTARWILIALLMLAGCVEHPDPSGTVTYEHEQKLQEIDDSVLPPKFNLGDVVSVGDEMSIGIVVWSGRLTVFEKDTWVYSVLCHNKTISYTESNLVLVEKFDWNRPAKKGIVD